MTNSKIIAIPKAPKELSDEARSLWQSLVRDYAIDDGAGASTEEPEHHRD